MHYDLCVIGGGINGAGIARDAAGRGLSVLLVEARDLGGATSSASTKLIHGGLRYLEYGAFKMVREALKERERLLRAAPHVIWPLRFVLPHAEGQRPAWMIRLGLFLYDHLGGRDLLPASRRVDLSAEDIGAAIKDDFDTGFVYSDCWAEDSRLVVLNARDAVDRGAQVMVQTRVEKIKQGVDGWSLHLHDKRSNKKQVVGASVVVNAAGPWARKVLDESGLSSEGTPSVRLVKGSHIIIPRHFEGDQCYILQQPDKRIVFAIPYEGKYTLIGTTEVAYHDDPYEAKITDEEIGYLCDAASRFLKKPVTRSDVEWSYSGVRPLFDDGSKNATSATRDYHVHVQGPATAPLYSVFGGKLTTYRIVAEDVVNRVMRQRNELVRPWTAEAHLPGGDIKNADFERFYEDNMARYPWLPEDLLLRYLRAYGTKIADIIMGGKTLEDLGRCFGDGVYEAEVRYLVRREWAREAEDILWRRSKLGLHVGGKTVTSLSLALPEIVKDEVGE